ncbi:MAG TPA: hypothetical protein VN108_05470 [Marmoricola sp.]|nr:hypothetical protein [Marmoricola sp.]
MGKVGIEELLASLGVDASKLTAEQVLQLGHEVAEVLNRHPAGSMTVGPSLEDRIVVRATSRAAKTLGIHPVADLEPGAHEWYLNIVWIEGRKNALLMHAATTFPILVRDVRAADLRRIGPWLRTTIEAALASEGLALETLGDFANCEVVVAKAIDRRVLGYMNQSTLYAEHRIDQEGGLAVTDIADLNHRLRRDLHSHGKTYASAIELITGRRR